MIAAAHEALKTAFGFAARDFGQPLTGSEILAVLQGVAGVVGADLDNLTQFRDGLKILSVAGPDGRLPANTARWQNNALLPADLLLLDPGAVILTERTP